MKELKISSKIQTESGSNVNGFQSKKTRKMREHDWHLMKSERFSLKKERRVSKDIVMVPMEAELGLKNFAIIDTTNSG